MYTIKKICTIGTRAFRPGDAVALKEQAAVKYLEAGYIEKTAEKTPVKRTRKAKNGSK